MTMDAPRTLHKIRSTNFSTMQSPNSSGRSTPLGTVKVSDRLINRPQSPSLNRQQYTIKRPPSANRYRPQSPFDSRTLRSEVDSRSTSSLSVRGVHNGLPATKDNTIVSIRVSPEQIPGSQKSWSYDKSDKCIRATQQNASVPSEFSFDHVFTEHDTNFCIYQTSVKKLVAGVVEGFHGTVFAYGMTGTGKTYSMQGVSESPGLIPQAVQDLLDLSSQDPDNTYTLRMSYLEIYNERIRDLLSCSVLEAEEIKIRDDPKRGIHAYPLVEIPIPTTAAFIQAMEQGDVLRHSAATDFNKHSSRSHAVIQLILECTPRSPVFGTSRISDNARISTLNLIDLAGSEKAATDMERRKEGSYINKSLLTLGTVIARLTTNPGNAGQAHVPFRDSKLTRLLQHALSGLSLVSILATINTDARYVMETSNTLKFAARAKHIPVRAKKAEMFSGDVDLLISSLRSEITSLQGQLAESRALVAKLQKLEYWGNRTVSDDYVTSSTASLDRIHEDEDVKQVIPGRFLAANEESSVIDVGRDDLQNAQSLSRAASDSIVHLPNSVVPGRVAPGNFSHPSHLSKDTVSADIINLQHVVHDNSNENEDKINALADKELVSTVLSRSQKSRDEARNLSIQIAELKRREDNKITLASRLGFASKSTEEKENSRNRVNKHGGKLQHTIVSPTIRAPREGFI